MADTKEYLPCSESSEGNIKISEDVVASIATIAAAETEGVSSMASSVGSDITEMFGRKGGPKGVKITLIDDLSCAIECFIVLKYGSSVTDVATEVQKNVKAAIESMAGIKVSSVNVQVTGIQLPKAANAKN